MVGSYNLDPRSERLNSETALAVRSDRVASDLQRWFETEYVAKSQEVSLEDAQAYRRAQNIDDAFRLAYALSIREWL